MLLEFVAAENDQALRVIVPSMILQTSCQMSPFHL